MTLSASSVLHYWNSRYGEIAPFGGYPTIVRNTSGKIVDSDGKLISALPNRPRFGWDFINGEWRQTMLLELGRSDLATYSENFGSGWTFINVTPTGGIDDPAGGLTAYSLNATVAGGDARLTVAFTGNATKALSLRMKKGTAGSSAIAIYDLTADAFRGIYTITWSGAGVPTVGAGSGTVFPVRSLTDGWYEIGVSNPGVIAANTNKIFIQPAASGTGTVLVWGVQTEDAPFPSSYIGPTTGSALSRSADAFYWRFTTPPKAMMIYSRFVEAGTALVGSSEPCSWSITDAAASTPYVFVSNAGSGYRATHNNGSAGVQTTALANPSIGDVVEHVLLLQAGGNIQLIQSLNGAAVTSTAVTGAAALAASWAAMRFALNSYGGGATGVEAARFAEIKVVKYADVMGSTPTDIMAELRGFDFDKQGNQL